MYKSLYLTAIFCLVTLLSYGQLKDDFSDGNITNDPVWTGQTGLFFVNPSSQLQANGPSASAQLFLSTASLLCRNTAWKFYVRMNFDLTTSNWAKCYLTSSQENTNESTNGYYLKFEGATNSIDLYKQNNALHTKLFSGKIGRAASTTMNEFLIYVLCDPFGKWHVYSDVTSSGNFFEKEGEAIDLEFSTAEFFSVGFTHTSTRRRGLLFDNLLIQEAPLLICSADVITPFSATLVFSKPLDLFSVNQPNAFRFKASLNLVSEVRLDEYDPTLVHLRFVKPISFSKPDTLFFETLLDNAQNRIGIVNSISLLYTRKIRYGDIVITELFPNPFPSKGLPEEEFVELFNRTVDTIDLKDIYLSDGSSSARFPSYIFPPRHYVSICSNTAAIQLTNFSRALGVSNFPTINNSGDHITLKTKDGVLIHEVDYTDSWYKDNDKKNGGWTLEMIDLNNPCGGEQNWGASLDDLGGSPGRQNSIVADKPDLTPPQLIISSIVNSNQIELYFNEQLDTLSLLPSSFQLTTKIVQQVRWETTIPFRVILFFTESFQPSEEYELAIYGIKDCNGNFQSIPERVRLQLPSPHQKGDVLLSEVLFNPKSGGVDFVELYNNSPRLIQLSHWSFSSFENEVRSSPKKISTQTILFPPKTYLAFTKNKDLLLNYYPSGCAANIIQVNELPAYNDDIGSVLVLDSASIEQEFLRYNEDSHYPLIDDRNGVSLERLSFSVEANNPENWFSSASPHYATPGCRNSQQQQSEVKKNFWVNPKVFTPNLDGYKDLAYIHYYLEESGWIMNTIIYDITGREIKRLVQNELLALEGFYVWDGTNANQQVVGSGTYVVHIELLNLNGELKKIKELVVVGWSN